MVQSCSWLIVWCTTSEIMSLWSLHVVVRSQGIVHGFDWFETDIYRKRYTSVGMNGGQAIPARPVVLRASCHWFIHHLMGWAFIGDPHEAFPMFAPLHLMIWVYTPKKSSSMLKLTCPAWNFPLPILLSRTFQVSLLKKNPPSHWDLHKQTIAFSPCISPIRWNLRLKGLNRRWGFVGCWSSWSFLGVGGLVPLNFLYVLEIFVLQQPGMFYFLTKMITWFYYSTSIWVLSTWLQLIFSYMDVHILQFLLWYFLAFVGVMWLSNAPLWSRWVMMSRYFQEDWKTHAFTKRSPLNSAPTQNRQVASRWNWSDNDNGSNFFLSRQASGDWISYR